VFVVGLRCDWVGLVDCGICVLGYCFGYLLLGCFVLVCLMVCLFAAGFV